MGSPEIDIILKRLEQMDADRKHDNERLHDKLDQLKSEGCSKASQHAAIQTDHEQRLRATERYINRQAGQVAVIATGVSAGTAILAAIGKTLLMRVGGHG